ncbi:hypothetical protein SCB49_06697 [unidentified eubacterium SCB49]|nr:hypothetical protein SCB49_06697 [unidentified eubacterium SCB49]
MEIIKMIHSFWAYLVVLAVLAATINGIIGLVGKKEYQPKDFRISLFALIVTHIQLVIGIIIFFVSPLGLQSILTNGMGEVMGDSFLRLYAVEHPMMMIITIVFVTMGYSKHKKKLVSGPKFKMLAIFYTLGLLCLLSRIPWSQWLNL